MRNKYIWTERQWLRKGGLVKRWGFQSSGGSSGEVTSGAESTHDQRAEPEPSSRVCPLCSFSMSQGFSVPSHDHPHPAVSGSCPACILLYPVHHLGQQSTRAWTTPGSSAPASLGVAPTHQASGKFFPKWFYLQLVNPTIFFSKFQIIHGTQYASIYFDHFLYIFLITFSALFIETELNQ